MSKLEILNIEQHAGLKLSRACDGSRHFAQIVADEFLSAMLHYPIFFTKSPETGRFYAGALLGLEPGESLMAQNGQLPGYRPADLERQGFFIADQHLAVDTDHPAFANPDGAPLFETDGSPSGALSRVQRALQVLNAGLEPTNALIERFLSNKLLEPIDVTLDFDDGGRLRLDGLYTVSMDALHSLPDEVALDLFRRGDLRLAYAQAASVPHLRTFAKVRNDRLADGSA